MGYTCRHKLAVAFHEAGHNCTALILGQRMGPASMIFRHDLTTTNSPVWAPPGFRPNVQLLEAHIMIGVAGPLAEDLSRDQFGAMANRFGHACSQSAIEAELHPLALEFVRGTRQRAQYLDHLRRRTQNLLTERGCWEAVSAVAWALVYRLQLSAAEVERIFWRTASVSHLV